MSSARERMLHGPVEVLYDPRPGVPSVPPEVGEERQPGIQRKDVHSQVATHTVGYGIGTVVASQANTGPAEDPKKKRRRRRVRALAYRRHADQG